MLARLGLLALVATSAPSGCEKLFGDGSADAHAPGTDLGSFSVIATLTENTCGDGALGVQSPWQFSVRLEEDPGILYWNNGQAVITGGILSDGVSFSFDASTVQDLRDPNVVGPPPCSIARVDHAEGKLDAATAPVHSFTGTLRYQYSATAGSTCDDLFDNGTAPVAVLPCDFSFQMVGTSTSTTE